MHLWSQATVDIHHAASPGGHWFHFELNCPQRLANTDPLNGPDTDDDADDDDDDCLGYVCPEESRIIKGVWRGICGWEAMVEGGWIVDGVDC